MSQLMSILFLAAAMALSLFLFSVTIGHPDQVSIVSAAAVGLIFVSLFMERIWPYRKEWNDNRGDVGGDVSSFILVFGMLDGLLKWASPFLLLSLIGTSTDTFNVLPLWLEILSVTLLIEFGAYWAHRIHHVFPKLWALHAMHHSPKRLYTLNNFRFHPLNHIVNHALMILPALALGFSPEALLGYVACATPVLMLQHSNIGFRFGWLDYVLNTNAVHRWHHSADGIEGNCNYGRAIVLWDHIFGTFYYPRPNDLPKKLGVQDGFTYPLEDRFLDQLKYPFSSQCCRPNSGNTG